MILIALKEGHPPTATYVAELRRVLPANFPEAVFYFQPADMVTQILNFGIPAQINVRTVGYDRQKNLRMAKELRGRIAAIPGVADVHLQQEVNAPELFAQIDRARASQFGFTANSIALNLNTSLSSSEQISPNFWTDPTNGTPYYFTVQTPEYRVSTLNELKNTPVATFTAGTRTPVPGLLSNVASLKRDLVPTNANQANVQPVYEIFANADGRDLGAISADINKIVADYQKQLSPGNRIEVIGQIDSMNAAFRDLAIGILFAAVFVYLLMVVNYQNWGDPFVVILALAGDAVRHRHHAVRHQHDIERPLPHGRHHGHRRGLGEFDPAGDVCPRAAACRHAGVRCRDLGRPHPDPAGADDRGGDDRRDDPDGHRRPGRGAERRLGARRDRRPAFCYTNHAACGAVSVRHAAQRQRRQAGAWRVRGGAAMNDIQQRPAAKAGVPLREAPPRPRRTPGDQTRTHLDPAGPTHRAAAARGRHVLAALCGIGSRLLAALPAARASHGDRGRAPRLRSQRTGGAGARQRQHAGGFLARHHRSLRASQYLARASGYISQRKVDIGSHVKAGDLLVEITALELEHQIAQAEGTLAQLQASLQQAKANRDLAQVTWDRDKTLVHQGWATQQQGDTDRLTLEAREAAVAVAAANITAQEAQLRVLNQQKAYQRVIAPFDGVITQRNVDVGSLVQADATSGTFLFALMHSDTIRIQLYVPQDEAFGVAPGVEATSACPRCRAGIFPARCRALPTRCSRERERC